jgi:hypothetical protein
MPFEIDTGLSDHDPLRLLPDWFLDLHDEPHDARRIMRAYAEHMVGQMAGPVKLDTVRKHLLMSWSFLRELATSDPEAFDWIATEYAERVFQHACASAPGGSGYPTPQIGQIDKGKQDEPVF